VRLGFDIGRAVSGIATECEYTDAETFRKRARQILGEAFEENGIPAEDPKLELVK
jgi:hypothetical protein